MAGLDRDIPFIEKPFLHKTSKRRSPAANQPVP